MTTLFALTLLAASIEVTVDYVTETETNRTVIFMRMEGTNRITLVEGKVVNIEPAKPPMVATNTLVAVSGSTAIRDASGTGRADAPKLPPLYGPPAPAMLTAPPVPPISWRVSKRLPGSVHIGSPLPLTNQVPMWRHYEGDYRVRK